MIRRLLAASVVVVVGLLPAAQPAIAEHISDQEKALRRKINAYRGEHGKDPLKMKHVLASKARKQAKTIDDDGVFNGCTPGAPGCTNSDHSTTQELTSYANAAGCDTGSSPIAEIIAAAPTLDEMIRGWDASTPHRKIMLKKKWERIGTGVFDDGEGTLWGVVLFCSTK